MKEIEENEDKIISKVILNKDGKVDGDENMYRVYWLIKHSLIFIGHSKKSAGWETLFYEPKTKTYWEQTFLNGEMQGGGPPSLFKISEEGAHKKYEFNNFA